MALTNAKLTEIIEKLSEKFVATLKAKKIKDPRTLVDRLLTPLEQGQTTLESINQQYYVLAFVTCGDSTLIPIPRFPRGPEGKALRATLTEAVVMHLMAISDGYNLYLHKQPAKKPAEQARPPQTTINIHHIHHYQRRSFLEDMLLWQLLSRPYYPPQPTRWLPSPPNVIAHNTNDSEDTKKAKMSLAAIFYLILAGGVAAVGTLYAGVHTLRSLGEIAHNENPLLNIAKLGVVGVATWQGALLGFAIGTLAFSMPVSGAILSGVFIAATLAGISYKLLNTLQSYYHASARTHSAIDGDNRFVLSAKQARNLAKEGFNVVAVNEALRELAIEFKQLDGNSLKIFSEGTKRRSEIIDLVRKLKSAEFDFTMLQVGCKLFNLEAPPQPERLPAVNPEFSGETGAHSPQFPQPAPMPTGAATDKPSAPPLPSYNEGRGYSGVFYPQLDPQYAPSAPPGYAPPSTAALAPTA